MSVEIPDLSRIPQATREQIARRQQQHAAEQVRLLQADWNAPKRHAQASPDFSGDWGNAFASLKAMLGSGALMALVGHRGSGKTQLAVELMRHVTQQQRRARFTTAIGFFMEIKATYRKDSKGDEREVLADYCKPSLLVIDEIGKRSDSEWENNLLFELLNRRYNACKDTVLIDNRSKADFIAAIGESLASRMNEGGGIKECNWKSYRE